MKTKTLNARNLEKSKEVVKNFVEVDFYRNDFDEYYLQLYSNQEKRDINIEDSSISCGIKQIEGIEELALFLTRCRNASKIKEEFDTHIVNKLDEAFEFIRKEVDSAFLIMSNKLKTKSDLLIASYLDKICASTEVKRNPNSGNNIKMWVY